MILMASCDENKTVCITSLNEQQKIKQYNLRHQVHSIAFLPKFKCMTMYNKNKKYFQVVDMDYPCKRDDVLPGTSIKYNILKQLVQGSEDEQLSCIEFLKNEQFLAYNINIINLLSI